MMDNVSIIDMTIDDVLKYGVCGYKNIKKEGLPEKLEWLRKRFSEGLKIKALYSEKDGTQGMIEYIPGKCCWRPVDVSGYMFIHHLYYRLVSRGAASPYDQRVSWHGAAIQCAAEKNRIWPVDRPRRSV